MYLDWTRHLNTEEEKQRFQRELLSSKPIFDRLKDILSDMERTQTRSEINENVFDQPNWEFRQAYKNGFKSALHKVIDLVDLDKKVIRP